MRRRLLAVAVLVGVTGLLASPAAAQDEPTDEEKLAQTCEGGAPGVVLETLDYETVDGATVRACLAFPEDGSATTLVTFAHGIGHHVQASWAPHVVRTAEQGAIAVATNYRDNFGFPTLRGAEDVIVLTKLLLDRFPAVDETIMFGVSMGGSVSGTALVEAPRLNDGEGLWDHWVFVEGVSNVAETYAEAVAAASAGNATAQRAKDGIERETGGTPVDSPQEYERRSPLFHANDIKSNGLQSAAVVHAAFDGLVGFHQGVTMAAALCTANVPTSFDAIVTGSGDDDDSTLADLVSSDLEDANQSTLDLSGHASEADAAHPVMARAFEILFAMLDGEPVSGGCAEIVAAVSPAPETESPSPAPGDTSSPSPAPTSSPTPAPAPTTTTAPAPTTPTRGSLPSTGGGAALLAALALAGTAATARRR